MLNFADFNLKLISDIETFQLIESRISGGVSVIFKSYVAAKNKFLKLCDANKPTSYDILRC